MGAGATTPPTVPAPRQTITAARPHVMPYEAPGGEYGVKSYAGFLRKRIWMIGIAALALTATSVAAVMLLHQRPTAPVVVL